MNKKVIIVGGVAGGATAATRLRRLEEDTEIIIIERDEYISFANCGLPYHIGGTIKEREKLLVQTPEAINTKFNIDVRNNSMVTEILSDKKIVKVKEKNGREYEESYDYLLLSPGAKPLVPSIPGIENSRIYALRNIPDMDRIIEHIDKEKVQSAIVVGGGFIGVEMAENLHERGMSVSLVEMADHILPPFDPDMAIIIEKELADMGINLYLKDGVTEFIDKENHVEVLLESGNRIEGQLIILAIGVRPETDFIAGSGIKTGERGHILVNEKMETSVPGIYAVGDAIEVEDIVTKMKTAIPLAGPANKQGRIAADQIAGMNNVYKGAQGTSILKVFDLTAASTGANGKSLQRAGLEFEQVIIHPMSHASYYPGALQMTLKLLFGKDGKVLGAQGIGYEGVDKRIDIIAAIIRLDGTVYDLEELELGYAPPYSSAKDPVNMLGFVAVNFLQGRSNLVTWEEVDQMNPEEYMLIDVRSELEFSNGHVEGAINIPGDSLRNRLEELDKNKTIVLYCKMGLNGYNSDRMLTQKGFRVRNVMGGYKTEVSRRFRPDQCAQNSSLNTFKKIETESDGTFAKELDACGLCCPGPLMQVKASMDELNEGEVLKVSASDQGFYEDVKAWAFRTGNELQNLYKESGNIIAYIKKGQGEMKNDQMQKEQTSFKDNKTMVVFSGDLDKAIASFIIANGAASMGKKVTMFFTFWGLNILRKPKKVSLKKNIIEKMFGFMMPRGSKKLKLSRMSMMGIGGKMIRGIMKKHNVLSLEELIESAMNSGVEVVACQMSMDLMGIRQEEMIEGVKLGGVGYYLGEAEDSNVNLFI